MRVRAYILYRCVFEMAAIPYNNESLKVIHDRPTKFFGFVNYSISPKGNKFEGDYQWEDKQYYTHYAHDIIETYRQFKFNFNEYASARTKLPCIIVANLVSPRSSIMGMINLISIRLRLKKQYSIPSERSPKVYRRSKTLGWHFISERKRELIVSDADKNITTELLTYGIP